MTSSSSVHVFRNGKTIYQDRPSLVEPGIKTYMFHTLSICHTYKHKYYEYILNVVSLLIFIILLCLFLGIKASSKLTKEEKEKQNNATQNYLLNKFKIFQHSKMIESQNIITNLPIY